MKRNEKTKAKLVPLPALAKEYHDPTKVYIPSITEGFINNQFTYFLFKASNCQIKITDVCP